MANYAPKKIFLTKRHDDSADSHVSISHLELKADSSLVDEAQAVSTDIHSGDVMVNGECIAWCDEGSSQLATLHRGHKSSSSLELSLTDSRQESLSSLFYDKNIASVEPDRASMLERRDCSYLTLPVYLDHRHFDTIKSHSGKEMSNFRVSSLHHNSQLMQPSVPGTMKSGGYYREDGVIGKQNSCMTNEIRSKPNNSTVFQIQTSEKGYTLPSNSSDRLPMVSSSCAVSSLTYTSSSNDADNANSWLPSRKWFSSSADNSESKESNPGHIESGMHVNLKMRVCKTNELVSDEQNIIRVSEQTTSSQNQYKMPLHARDCTESNSSSRRSSERPSSSGDAEEDVVDDDEMQLQVTEERESSSFVLNDAQPQYLTTSGRNRGRGKANEPKYECQVCGDVAAGFHCGAYVCEACKKFYLRCLKMGNSPPFLCPKANNCEINKDTRSHCQFCRFKKCMYLGMYKPGCEVDKKLKVTFKSISCKVCNAPSSGFHFGAITCEGCKGFFRRMLREQLHKKFLCTNGESCIIDSANRTNCKCCRFAKCLRVGMTLEGTRLGRQSNSVKLSTLMQYHADPSDAPSQPDSFVEMDGSQQMCSADDSIGDDDDDHSFSDSDRHFDMPFDASGRGRKKSSECSTVASEQGPPALEHISQIRYSKSYSSTTLDDFELRSWETDQEAVASSSKYPDHRRYSSRNSMEYAKSVDNYRRHQDGHRIHKRSFSSSDHMESCSSGQYAPQREYDAPLSQNQTPTSLVYDKQRFNEKQSAFSKQIVTTPTHWHGSVGTSVTSQQRCDMFNASKYSSTCQMGLSPVILDTDPTLSNSTRPPSTTASSCQSPAFKLKPMQLRAGSTSETCAQAQDSSGGRLVCFLRVSDIVTIMNAKHDNDAPGRKGHDTGFNIRLYDNPKALFCCLSEEFTKLEKMMYRPSEMDALQNCPATWESLWNFVELIFMHQARVVLQFIKRIPGFRLLPIDDQVKMAQDSLYPLLLIFHSQYYDMETGNHNYFICTPAECELIIRLLPPFATLRSHFASTGFSLKQLNMSSVEIAFLSTMTVLTAVEGFATKSSSGTINLEDRLLEAFVEHSADKMDAFRLSLLLARLPELRRANIEHELIVAQVQQMMPHLKRETQRIGASST